MDATQDKADRHVLLITTDYLASRYCRHEMHRAILLDPDFAAGKVIPVKLVGAALPGKIKTPNPPYVDLRNGEAADQWQLLIEQCGGELKMNAPNWLAALDRAKRHLERGECVNVQVSGEVNWRTWLDQLCQTRFSKLYIVDLENPAAVSRNGMISEMRLFWIFAGSHHITELKHAPWDSYLVSVRTIEVPPFSEPETRLLLTEPLKESPLFGRDDAQRPRFDAAFWGDHSIEWIHRETGGWPHLVQVVARTADDLVNEANVAALEPNMLERAANRSIVDGDTVLRQLMRGESELSGEWEYLAGFRSKNEQQPPHDEAIFQSLRRRQLITEEAGMWRLPRALMQRWLRQRG